MAMYFQVLSKNVYVYLHPKAHMYAKFHGNRSKSVKVAHNARLYIILAQNINSVTMATLTLSLLKNVSC